MEVFADSSLIFQAEKCQLCFPNPGNVICGVTAVSILDPFLFLKYLSFTSILRFTSITTLYFFSM